GPRGPLRCGWAAVSARKSQTARRAFNDLLNRANEARQDVSGADTQTCRRARLSSAGHVLPSGKPTMNSRGILELALDLENGKRPCAEYGGGGDERCKYYSHGTLANEMARPCCIHADSLSIFV